MRRTPDKLIACLRNRRSRIIAYAILNVLFLGLLGILVFFLIRMCQSLVPKEGQDMVLHVIVSQQVLVGIAFIETMSLILACSLGLVMAMLINEIAAYTKNDLLVALWDRLQVLEQSQSACTNL